MLPIGRVFIIFVLQLIIRAHGQMEPKDFTQKYVILQKVAEGSYGVVYKARSKATKQFVAVKKFKSTGKLGLPVSFIRQHYLLSILSGEHFLKMIEAFSNHQEPLIVMEWMHFNLDQLVSSKVKYPVKALFHQIVKALSDFHENDVIHRDIKPSNIMLAPKNHQILPQPEGAEMVVKDYHVKIIDYGMAKQLDFERKEMSNMVGSLYYRSPELILGETWYGKEVDIWSLGCIFFLMNTGKLLFQADNEEDQFKSIISILGVKKNTIKSLPLLARLQQWELQDRQQNWASVHVQVNEIEFDLLSQMITLDPSERISCSQILKHPYFQ